VSNEKLRENEYATFSNFLILYHIIFGSNEEAQIGIYELSA